MSHKNITRAEKERVYADGKRAFVERKHRGYNPYAQNNLTLAVHWWHGWDTAEEESKGEAPLLHQTDTFA